MEKKPNVGFLKIKVGGKGVFKPPKDSKNEKKTLKTKKKTLKTKK